MKNAMSSADISDLYSDKQLHYFDEERQNGSQSLSAMGQNRGSESENIATVAYGSKRILEADCQINNNVRYTSILDALVVGEKVPCSLFTEKRHSLRLNALERNADCRTGLALA